MDKAIVAKTILQQLGGQRFLAMTGAKNLTAHESALSFRLPARLAKDGINFVTITLNDLDLYDVTFERVRSLKRTPVSAVSGVYADNLRDVFTDTTALILSI